MNKKKILITGSCGFVFGNFIRKAIYEKQPYSFVSLDRVNANAINSMYWNKNHTFHIADVIDQHIIDIIFQFEKPDIVIHGAAEESTIDNLHITSNVLGTQVITNACIKYNVEKLIYISTDKVYGPLTSEQDLPYTEESPINPKSSYAASKAAGELIVKSANQSNGLKYNIIRSSNNYGPRQTINKLIPKTIKSILQDNPITVYGKGLQLRDWIHVFDNCSGIFTVLNSGLPNEIYNISSNQEFNNIEVIQKVCNAMKKGYNLVSYTDDPQNNNEFRYSLNSNKLKNLGWKPNIKLSDGLEQSLLWFLNNQWWFK